MIGLQVGIWYWGISWGIYWGTKKQFCIDFIFLWKYIISELWERDWLIDKRKGSLMNRSLFSCLSLVKFVPMKNNHVFNGILQLFVKYSKRKTGGKVSWSQIYYQWLCLDPASSLPSFLFKIFENKKVNFWFQRVWSC